MTQPICILRAIVRSLRLRTRVSGHAYEELDGTPPNVQVLRCRVCGHHSVGYFRSEPR